MTPLPDGYAGRASGPPGGWLICADCGAIVHPDHYQTHDEHHAALDQLNSAVWRADK